MIQLEHIQQFPKTYPTTSTDRKAQLASLLTYTKFQKCSAKGLGIGGETMYNAETKALTSRVRFEWLQSIGGIVKDGLQYVFHNFLISFFIFEQIYDGKLAIDEMLHLVTTFQGKLRVVSRDGSIGAIAFGKETSIKNQRSPKT